MEFLCRACVSNTRGRNCEPEGVSILKTPGLKEKVEKFLEINISETDAVSKVLCKQCFRHVETIASLSKTAKNTQYLLREMANPPQELEFRTIEEGNSMEYFQAHPPPCITLTSSHISADASTANKVAKHKQPIKATVPDAEAAINTLKNTLRYRLPAETTAKLMQVSPEVNHNIKFNYGFQNLKNSTNSQLKSLPPKKLRKVLLRKTGPSVVKICKRSARYSRSSPNKAAPLNVDHDSTLHSQFNLSDASASTRRDANNEALRALLQRQCIALNRTKNFKRNSSNLNMPANSYDSINFNVDGIVLLEPDQDLIESQPAEVTSIGINTHRDVMKEPPA